MGHYARPIIGTTAAGAGETYVILNRYTEKTRIETSVNGTVTDYDVDVTIDNIAFGDLPASNAQFVNNTNYVAPASAVWQATSINAASGSANVDLTSPVFAARINIVTGTGSVSYRILQVG